MIRQPIIVMLSVDNNCNSKASVPDLDELVDYEQGAKIATVPLDFQFIPVQIIAKQFTKLNNPHPFRIHYLGPHFTTTAEVHKKFAFTEKHPFIYNSEVLQSVDIKRYQVNSMTIVQSYNMNERLRKNQYYKSALFYRAFEGMNPSLKLQNQYVFNSVFEGGNLDCVIKINPVEYDLFLRIDSNTRGHMHWFYFSIKNGSKTQKVKLNICNFKSTSLYSHGMQPYVYSSQQFLKTKVQWQQTGINHGVTSRELRYDTLHNKPHNKMSCFTFEYEFQHANDQVFFAYCVPFTYSKLLHEIGLLPSAIVKKTSLCKSLLGVQIPLLFISNHEATSRNKYNVLITGRVHPAESNSSHTLMGFINYVCSNEKSAQAIREKVNFFIVPMLNPDGVIIGNSRTSGAGRDLNREFISTDPLLYPEVYHIKELAKKLQNTYGAMLYMDFHGHSCKKNTFFYGPSYSIRQQNYYTSRILPKLIEKISPYFRYHSCSFNIVDEKKKTARAMMFEHLEIPYTFTVETSIGFYYDSQKMKTFKCDRQHWNQIGSAIAEGTFLFISGLDDYEQLIRERRIARQKRYKRERIPKTPQLGFAEEEAYYPFEKNQPLKISYHYQNTGKKDKDIFISILDEINEGAAQSPNPASKTENSCLKELDEEVSSDEHDSAQDLSITKFQEFHNMVIDTTKKANPVQYQRFANQITANKEAEEERKLLLQKKRKDIRISPHKDKEQSADKRQKTEEQNRPSSFQASRTSKAGKNPKYKCNQMKLQEYADCQLGAIGDNRIEFFERKDNNKKKAFSKANSGKSHNELGFNVTTGFFGEYRFDIDPQSKEGRGKKFQRRSLFSRDSARRQNKGADSGFNSRTQIQENMQDSRRSPIKYSQQIGNSEKIKQLVQFNFDQIEDNLDEKSKNLKESIRNKVSNRNYCSKSKNKSSSFAVPASFYSLKQHLSKTKDEKTNSAKFYKIKLNLQELKHRTNSYNPGFMVNKLQ